MSSQARRSRRNEAEEPSGVESRPSQQVGLGATLTTAVEVLKDTQESSSNIIASSIVGANPIEIDVQDETRSVKFLPDGKHVVSAGSKGKIRRWRVADGKEVGKEMDAGSPIRDAAVSRDGKWIVAGVKDGRVTVWNAMTHEKTTEFKAHGREVKAVDISPDSTRIATGSLDYTLNVWSLSTGQRRVGPLKHDNYVFAVKFSPDGQFIATATYNHRSVRVYDSRDGRLLADFPINIRSGLNGSLAWTSDDKQLLVLSDIGDIHCLEVSTWKTLSRWSTRENHAYFISLTPNDRFIATSGIYLSFSLWDAISHQHLVTVEIPGSPSLSPMAISPNYDIVAAPNRKINLRHLLDFLPSHYRGNLKQTLLEPRRSRTENVDLGNTVNGKDHDTTIRYYSSALSHDPTNSNDITVKCCKAQAGLLEEKLVSVNKVIEHDPSNYKGYKKKHSVLHSMGRYREAFSAFEMMLSTMNNSADPQICELRSRYLDTTPLIREVVDDTIRDIPRVLIDTVTGRLYDKTQQATAFEELLIFDELRSTMTTHDLLDHARIKEEVEKFYQYVMFSHRWQPAEPTFQMVEDISIYELPESPTVEKLVNFCNVVQSHRFRWAWSDTCCVNQADKGVQQESVVAMFRWYRRAAFTIVHLLGVLSESQQEGDLWKSIWNTRGWTYQEYVASRVIRFYTEDWKPYLSLDMFNHKESPIILSEMEQATQFATEKLTTIQPGLEMVREKLCLASKRKTTREEDIAYSLFGIFNVAIPIIYGEGNQAVGRLLEYILTRSDNVTILAWTGTSGSHHSYLPSNLTVYDQILPPHVPQPIEKAEMDRMVICLRLSFPDPSLIVMLYERLLALPSLSLVSGRLRLPGLVFRLTGLPQLVSRNSDSSLHVYRATAPIFGEVWIETKDDSLGTQRLVLVHPWISPLLDEDFSGDDPLFDLDVRALRILVRLRQPFGALLLASQKRGQYKRVATDSFVQVQIRAGTSLSELVARIGTVDVQ